MQVQLLQMELASEALRDIIDASQRISQRLRGIPIEIVDWTDDSTVSSLVCATDGATL
jgi:hypothetical protein